MANGTIQIDVAKRRSDFPLNSKTLLFYFIILTLIMCSSSANAAIIASYDFNESTGTLAEDSIGSHNGTLGANAIWGIDSVIFNNTANSVVTVSDNSVFDFTNESFSVLTRIKPHTDIDSLSADMSIARKRAATYSSSGWAVGVEQYSGQAMCVWLDSSATNTVSDASLDWSANSSYWLGYSYNASTKTVQFVRDGLNAGTGTFAGITSAIANSDDVLIGSPIVGGTGFDGDMYDFLIFNGSMTVDEMAAYMSTDPTSYYLSTTGSDSNNGTTESTPFLTATYATSQMKPGDALYIFPGTYNENLTIPSGSSNGYTTVSGYGGLPEFTNGVGDYGININSKAYINISNIVSHGWNYTLNGWNANNINLENVHTYDGGDGFSFGYDCYNISMIDSSTHDNWDHGIFVGLHKTGEVEHNRTNFYFNNVTSYNAVHNMFDFKTNINGIDMIDCSAYFTDSHPDINASDKQYGVVFHNSNTENITIDGLNITNVERPFVMWNTRNVIANDVSITNINRNSSATSVTPYGVLFFGYNATDTTIQSFEGMQNVTFTNLTVDDVGVSGGFSSGYYLGFDDFDSTPSEFSINISDYSFTNAVSEDVFLSGDVYNISLNFDDGSISGVPNTFVGTSFNLPMNYSWFVDLAGVQTNTSVTSASYTNTTAPTGIYNVTASATDGSTNVTQTWTWTVTDSEPFVNPVFVIVTFVGSAGAFAIGSWLNRRRRR